jgi:hypothetical protein
MLAGTMAAPRANDLKHWHFRLWPFNSFCLGLCEFCFGRIFVNNFRNLFWA